MGGLSRWYQNRKCKWRYLVDHNHSDSKTEIPDWQLGTIEFFFQREESYRIQKLDGHTVYVNNVPLDDSSTIRISTTYAEKYLPEGITGVRVCTQEISGLVAIPSVQIVDGSGNEMAVSYDAASRTFIEQTTDSTINDTERNLAISAVKTYALYMINQAGEADIAKYFLRGHGCPPEPVGSGAGGGQPAIRGVRLRPDAVLPIYAPLPFQSGISFLLDRSFYFSADLPLSGFFPDGGFSHFWHSALL